MAGGNYTVKSKAADRYTGDFQKLYDSMHGLKDQMTETWISIGEASNQVSAGSDVLANASQCLAEGAADQISGVIQSNAATAEEASATSQELSAQATMLDQLVGQFELGNR